MRVGACVSEVSPKMPLTRCCSTTTLAARLAPRQGAKPAVIYIGEWGDRNLRVYVERDSDPPRVTTVAWEE